MDLVGLLVTVIILGLICYILWWGLGQLKLGPPFDKVVTVIFVLIIVLVLLGLLTGRVPLFNFR